MVPKLDQQRGYASQCRIPFCYSVAMKQGKKPAIGQFMGQARGKELRQITTSFQCSNCRELELQFSKARSAALADAMLLDIIHRYKYSRALWFEPFLAGLLINAATPGLLSEQWDLIVPVPLHSLKRTEREFNQAERLARQLSDATQISLECRLLRFRDGGDHQAQPERPGKIE